MFARKRKETILCVLLAIGGSGLLSACYTDGEQTGYHLFPDRKWARCDSLALPVDSVPFPGEYNLIVWVRTPSDMLGTYRTVFINVRERGLNLKPVLNDTIAFSLRNEHIRKGRNGVAYHAIEKSIRRVSLTAGSQGEVILSHAMAADSLTGISEVGYRLEPADQYK